MSTGVEDNNDNDLIQESELDAYAVITDAHLAFRQVSDSPGKYVKLGIVDGMPYYQSTLNNLKDLRTLKSKGKLKKIVLTGDVFDHILSEGPNVIHEYLKVGEPQEIKGTKFDMPNFKAFYEVYMDLAAEVKEGIATGDMVYVIGNHEDSEKLDELGIAYVKKYEADDLLFVHGHETDYLLSLFGLAPDTGGFRGKIGSWAHTIMSARKPESGKKRLAASLIKNTTRIYGLVNYFANEIFQDLGKEPFEKYEARIKEKFGDNLEEHELEVLRAYHEDFVNHGFGLYRATKYLEGYSKRNGGKFIVMGHEHTPFIHKNGVAFSNLYSGGVSFIGKKGDKIRAIHGIEGAGGVLEETPDGSYSKLFTRATVSEYQGSDADIRWKFHPGLKKSTSEDHLSYVSDLLEKTYSSISQAEPSDLSQMAQETSQKQYVTPLLSVQS